MGLPLVRACAHRLSWAVRPGVALRAGTCAGGQRAAALPAINAAFAEGRLSHSKVRALTRVARPANEAELPEMGLAATAAQLELIVRTYRRGVAAEESGAAQERHRRRLLRLLRWYHDDDGMLVIQVRLPAEEGAVVVKALESAADILDQPEPAHSGHSAAGACSASGDTPAEVSAEAGHVAR